MVGNIFKRKTNELTFAIQKKVMMVILRLIKFEKNLLIYQ